MGQDLKRFTETNKWRDHWYRKLSSPAKQLWEYLRDNCDAIGLIELDFGLVSSDCGQPINEKHISELGDRVQPLGNDRYFLTKFIYFQYGELSETCPPHRTIIKLANAHSLLRKGLYHEYPNARVSLPYRNGQDKKGQEDRGVGEGTEVPATNRFQKPSEAELELYAAKIGLPVPERCKFFDHYESNGWKVGRNPMKSWQAAMRNWKLNVEQCTFVGLSGQKPVTETLMDKQLKALQKL